MSPFIEHCHAPIASPFIHFFVGNDIFQLEETNELTDDAFVDFVDSDVTPIMRSGARRRSHSFSHFSYSHRDMNVSLPTDIKTCASPKMSSSASRSSSPTPKAANCRVELPSLSTQFSEADFEENLKTTPLTASQSSSPRAVSNADACSLSVASTADTSCQACLESQDSGRRRNTRVRGGKRHGGRKYGEDPMEVQPVEISKIATPFKLQPKEDLLKELSKTGAAALSRAVLMAKDLRK